MIFLVYFFVYDMLSPKRSNTSCTENTKSVQSESDLFSGLCRAKENGHERQPHDAGGVHGKADRLSFIEGLGHTPALDGVDGAGDHQHDAVAQTTDE